MAEIVLITDLVQVRFTHREVECLIDSLKCLLMQPRSVDVEAHKGKELAESLARFLDEAMSPRIV